MAAGRALSAAQQLESAARYACELEPPSSHFRPLGLRAGGSWLAERPPDRRCEREAKRALVGAYYTDDYVMSKKAEKKHGGLCLPRRMSCRRPHLAAQKPQPVIRHSFLSRLTLCLDTVARPIRQLLKPAHPRLLSACDNSLATTVRYFPRDVLHTAVVSSKKPCRDEHQIRHKTIRMRSPTVFGP